MIIVQDNKEKIPWNFSIYSTCTGQVIQHLVTGDYTIQGLEDTVVIERKKTTGEIAINLGSKISRFESEFQRMSRFKYKFLVCEFSLHDIQSFPINSGIPFALRKRLRMNGKYILSRLTFLCDEYGVELHLCGNTQLAQDTVINILSNIYAEEIVNRKTN